MTYPTAPTSDQVDDYHGTRIADPYRPLEDSDAPEVRVWIAAQNELTERHLAAYPGRAAIRERLGQLWDYPRAGVPKRHGKGWFQMRNTGLQDQDVLWTADAPDGEGSVLIDPNRLNEKGITYLSAVDASHSGELVAYGLSDAGSDWRTWRVRRVATGEDLADAIPWTKFSPAAWTHDDAGFFYERSQEPPPGGAFDAPDLGRDVRYHRLGSDPTNDPIVFAPDQPEWFFAPEISDDGRVLILTVFRGTDPETRIFVADLPAGSDPAAASVRPLLDRADARYAPIATVGRTLYAFTDLDAPNGRVIAVDIDDPDHPREVIAEASDAIENVHLVGGRFAVAYLHDAHGRLAVFELDGRHVADVELPGIGSILDMAGKREDEELFIQYATFSAPQRVLGVRMADMTVRDVRPPELHWDPADFVTELAFVTSDDGTQVPLFLGHRRDVEPTGEVPTMLYGYGGFQIAMSPFFKPEWLLWMERGGLLAVAALRGGGEYGKAWYEAGRLANKQNGFDDFAACARWLAASGWTRRERIGAIGRSNGGLLVGAALTQHPELFGAVVPEVGVLDMLRFDKFTVGWGWTSDYGSSDDPEQFRTLMAYSPLHNLRPEAAYPPTLLTTGDHDDRVVPAHSFKFAAAAQAAQSGDAPILIRIDVDAGHGLGKPVSKLIDERADVLTFLDMTLSR